MIVDLHIVLVVRSLKIKKEKIIKKTEDSRCIYQNELDKAYFQHDMTCRDFKSLNRRAAADKVLRDKPFDIAKNSKYDGYQFWLVLMNSTFFDKKASGEIVKNENISNKELTREYTSQFFKKLRKEK